MKTALIHDWLTGMRGGEKVLELIAKNFPEAPIYTLLHVPDSVSKEIENHPIKTSLLQNLPYAQSRYRYYLPVFPLLAETHKARSYDLVVSTSHAVAKNMVGGRVSRSGLHVCYVHSPMRYVWDRFDDYFGPQKVGKWKSRLLFAPVARVLRWYDRLTAGRVDTYLANSRFVAQRIKKFYGRDAEVLAPPVNVQRFSRVKRSPQAWYLIVSAMVPYKRIDHAIKACAELNVPLKIVGSGPEEKKLKALAKRLGSPVEFYGAIEDDQLLEFYSQAKALLFPGVEDFGIVPVEAIAAGCPVIGLAEGGLLDSMTDKTALFYHDATVQGLVKAIREFQIDPQRFRGEDLKLRAQEFSEENFTVKFKEVVQRAWDKKQNPNSKLF